MSEHRTIDGRPARVAYLTSDFEPATADSFDLMKVMFDDGTLLFLTRPYDDGADEAAGFNRHRHKHRRALDGGANDHDGAAESAAFAKHRMKHQRPLSVVVITGALAEDDESVNLEGDIAAIPVKLQLVAWAKAIMVLDASEVIVRDLIERELAGKTGPAAEFMPMKSLAVVDKIVAEIRVVREDAIRLAFRLLRDRLGDHTILDTSLAKWAVYFAKVDIQAIDAAIRAGLINGDDNTEIARKVVGSMGLNGVDGVTEYTRHKIAHLGRAAIKDRNLRTAGVEIP